MRIRLLCWDRNLLKGELDVGIQEDGHPGCKKLISASKSKHLGHIQARNGLR